ncbi:GH19912 [Drosophila grimshawi]|uniref:GH19912 n=1 Tax=Drosophila grimshawi TaxID=7222 RepID=B4JRK3_DROGR|nr:GH19912 [Drosophila grimshawi]
MSNLSKRVNSFLALFRKKPEQEFNLLILGLNHAGKTTLAARIGSESEEAIRSITPTTNQTEKHLRFKKLKVCMRDVSGQWRMRQTWHTYYQEANVLIFVVDSTDAFRLAEARCELCDVLLDERLSEVPLLILANKQDALGALPSAIITDLLGLRQLGGRLWHIQECSALGNDGIDVSMKFGTESIYISSNYTFPMPDHQ